jgi:SHS2 domain-containing protein
VGFRYRPHTADEILEAWGETEEECLSQLATGFVAGFAQPAQQSPEAAPVGFAIELGTSASPADRAVALLEEIIFMCETQGQVPVKTEVTRASDSEIEGTFYVLDVEDVEEVGAVPKAVSYSGLEVIRDQEGKWKATVTIDV